MRRRIVCGITGFALLALAGCGSAPTATTAKPAATATVTHGDLKQTSSQSGSLGYGDARPLAADGSGTITSLPSVGSRVKQGENLYTLDQTPVVLMHGAVPAWRDLGPGVFAGADVRQLEEDLRALGYGSGLTVDDSWTSATTTAVQRWQKANNLTQTGRVSLGQVVFAPDDVRVAVLTVHLGDRIHPGTPIMDISSATRIAVASLNPTDRAMAAPGSEVALAFADGTNAQGTVRSVVDVPATQQAGESLQVSVSVPDTEPVAAQLDGASVQMTFTYVIAKDVLSVPITALVALANGGFGVEKVVGGAKTYVAVTPGAFADTAVQVSSPDLKAGDTVVVTP